MQYGSPADKCHTCGDPLRDCVCDHSYDCPVCETMAEEWNGDGCSCWWCPSCKITNPEHIEVCECGRGQVMVTYELNVTFIATRELSEAERLALLGAVLAQVEEPAGIGGSKRADYSTVTLSERLELVEGVTE